MTKVLTKEQLESITESEIRAYKNLKAIIDDACRGKELLHVRFLRWEKNKYGCNVAIGICKYGNTHEFLGAYSWQKSEVERHGWSLSVPIKAI